jgi:hypothetical protein
MVTAVGRMMVVVLFRQNRSIEPSIGSTDLLLEPAMMRLTSSA